MSPSTNRQVPLHVRLNRPDESRLRLIASAQHDLPLTYGEHGATRGRELPADYHHDRRSVVIGSDFAAAVEKLQGWVAHRSSGMAVATDGLLVTGTHVAMATPLPLVGYVLAACRIVYVEHTDTTFAFGYGTLPIHPECGEERFAVLRQGNEVRFELTAFSRPNSRLVGLAGPVARHLQASIGDRYIAAMSG